MSEPRPISPVEEESDSSDRAREDRPITPVEEAANASDKEEKAESRRGSQSSDGSKVVIGVPPQAEVLLESGEDEDLDFFRNIIKTDSDDKPPPYNKGSLPQYPTGPAKLMGTILQAKLESSGNVDFARRVVFGICCGTICCGIVIALHLAIPVAMIAIGSIYLKQCPRQKYIPIYLLVGGCFGVAKAIINIVDEARKKVIAKKALRSGHVPAPKPNPADGIVSCFLSAWFITGCVWIYGIHGDYQSTDPGAEDYCHETLYLFAFWLTTSCFILIGLAMCCCCALTIGMCVVARKTSTAMGKLDFDD